MTLALFALLVAALLFVAAVWPSLSLAPWVPTRRVDFGRIERLMTLAPGEKVVELGCGDGRVSAYIAKRHPDNEIVGIELSFLLYACARVRQKLSGLSNLRIVLGDALRTDLSDAQVVYAFGVPTSVNQKLKPKLDAELKRGARFLSYSFEISGDPRVSADAPLGRTPIYLCRY